MLKSKSIGIGGVLFLVGAGVLFFYGCYLAVMANMIVGISVVMMLVGIGLEGLYNSTGKGQDLEPKGAKRTVAPEDVRHLFDKKDTGDQIKAEFTEKLKGQGCMSTERFEELAYPYFGIIHSEWPQYVSDLYHQRCGHVHQRHSA